MPTNGSLNSAWQVDEQLAPAVSIAEGAKTFECRQCCHFRRRLPACATRNSSHNFFQLYNGPHSQTASLELSAAAQFAPTSCSLAPTTSHHRRLCAPISHKPQAQAAAQRQRLQRLSFSTASSAHTSGRCRMVDIWFPVDPTLAHYAPKLRCLQNLKGRSNTLGLRLKLARHSID